jgi:hypothetical protein
VAWGNILSLAHPRIQDCRTFLVYNAHPRVCSIAVAALILLALGFSHVKFKIRAIYCTMVCYTLCYTYTILRPMQKGRLRRCLESFMGRKKHAQDVRQFNHHRAWHTVIDPVGNNQFGRIVRHFNHTAHEMNLGAIILLANV